MIALDRTRLTGRLLLRAGSRDLRRSRERERRGCRAARGRAAEERIRTRWRAGSTSFARTRTPRM